MKIIIENTNLVDKELDNKIRKKLKDTVQELDMKDFLNYIITQDEYYEL